MKIIYNPKDGAPITSFISGGSVLSPHYPDGYALPNGKVSRGLMQYSDDVAGAIVETYGFLKLLTDDEAKKLMQRPDEPTFSCDYPGCDFKTHAQIALAGHKRTHPAKTEDPISPDIPVAQGKKIEVPVINNNHAPSGEIPNGPDKDGVDWYGEGATIETRKPVAQFGSVPPIGKAHF